MSRPDNPAVRRCGVGESLPDQVKHPAAPIRQPSCETRHACPSYARLRRQSSLTSPDSSYTVKSLPVPVVLVSRAWWQTPGVSAFGVALPFRTTLMSHGYGPQDVQRALRQANLRITLETYVHWLPKKDRPRGVVGQLLQGGRVPLAATPSVQDPR
jgi:hypothetical protein